MLRLVLHQIDRSPPCRAVLMVKELLGLDIDVVNVNTFGGDQFKPEFLTKNPAHTVPLLEDRDFFLADSHSIITYLVSKYGAEYRAELYPSDLKTRATIEQRLYFDASILFPRIRAILEAIIKDKATSPPKDLVAKVEESYDILQKYLEASPFLASDSMTLADISLVASVTSGNVLVPINEKYTRIHEWVASFNGKDWYEKGNLPGLKNFEAGINMLLKKNASS